MKDIRDAGFSERCIQLRLRTAREEHNCGVITLPNEVRNDTDQLDLSIMSIALVDTVKQKDERVQAPGVVHELEKRLKNKRFELSFE